MQRDFYKVTELTKEINEAIENYVRACDSSNGAENMAAPLRAAWHMSILTGQVRVQLAIAQQLTMCAAALKTLADPAKQVQSEETADDE
jgi:hypothetical protein